MPQARRTSWLQAVALLVALGALAIGLAITDEAGPSPTFASHRPRAPHPGDGRVHVAGSGSNLPLTRALAERFEQKHPGVHVVVHESIGSTGGVRAVRDGAVDVGLVSRPLRESERDASLRVIPYASVPIAVVVGSDVREHEISRADLVAIFSGVRATWRDGAPIVLFLRERGDSGQEALARAIPGFEEALASAHAGAAHRVVYHDADLSRAVASVGLALGISDLVRARREGLAMLSIDGAPPSAEALESGRYPYGKDLAFVVREPVAGDARAFVAWATSSDAARELIAEMGALPIREPSP